MVEKFIRAVGYALKGIAYGLKNERNFRIDTVAFIAVARFAVLYGLDRTGWAVLTVFLFAVPAAELFNTAVEKAVDRPDGEHYGSAGIAKDAAAGAVLLCALGAVAAAVALFSDRQKLAGVLRHFTSSPLRMAMLAAFIVAAYLFVTLDRFRKGGK